MKSIVFATIVLFMLLVVSQTTFNPHGVNLDVVKVFDVSTSET